MRKIIVWLCLAMLSVGIVWGDSVTLKTGQTFTGEIISETRDHVVIKTAGGVMTFSQHKIDSVKSDRKLRMEFKKRYARLSAKSIQQHLDLAKWCLGNNLSDRAHAHYLRVLELEPDNAVAKLGLQSVVARGPTQSQVNIKLHLVDGSVVKGSTSETHLAIATAYGELRIPFAIIVSVTLNPKRGGDKIVTRKFPVAGDISNEKLVIITKMGRLSVPMSNIARFKTKHKPSPTFIADTLDADTDNLRDIGLEVMLVYDATDSMEAALVGLKRRFRKMSHCLKARVPRVRMGLIAYRDSKKYDPQEFTYQVKLICPLTDDLSRVRTLLLSQKVTGGGDIPEAVHEGLRTAMEKAGWSADARKIIILLGDAPPHKQDDGLNKLYTMVQNWTTSAKGFVHTIDTTGYGKHMREFKEIARRGGGSSFAMSHENLLARQVTVCILGPRWVGQITEAYQATPDSAPPRQPDGLE